jgi:hypothetical protein
MTIPDAPSDANTYGRHAGAWNAVATAAAGVSSWNTRTGAVTMTSADVTGSLGFTPYNATNPAGYQTAAQVSAALPVASSTTPLMDGTVAIGTGTTWARADHVHPSDTSRAPLASPALTGTPTAPTAVPGTNTMQLATTAFVAISFAPLASPTFTGTVSMAGAATVGGNLTVTGNLATTAGYISAVGTLSTSGANGTVQFQDRTGSAWWGWYATANIGRLSNGTADVLSLDASGNLALAGATLPTAAAAGFQNVFANQNFIASCSSGNAAHLGCNIYWGPSGWTYRGPTAGAATVAVSSSNGTFQWYNAPSGAAGAAVTLTQTMVLDASGNLTISGATATKPGGGSWTAPSDAALKATINPYEGGLKEVIQLEPIKYYYSGTAGLPTGEEFIGLDAAATARIMPELIGADSWTDPDDPDGEAVHYGTVDSGPLIYALVNAVKELAARVDALEARIAALEGVRH